MKLTLELLEDKTKLELDELCAISQKWTIHQAPSEFKGLFADAYTWQSAEGNDRGFKHLYQPTTNKAQAWDLAIILLNKGIQLKELNGEYFTDDFGGNYHCPLKAIVISFILSGAT